MDPETVYSIYIMMVLVSTMILFGAFLYLTATRNEKMVSVNSPAKHDADQIRHRKTLGKLFIIPGMVQFIGLSLALLGGTWVYLGMMVFLAGGLLFMVMCLMIIRSNNKHQSSSQNED